MTDLSDHHKVYGFEPDIHRYLRSRIHRDLGLCHPKAFDNFRQLTLMLESTHRNKMARTLFKPFETYRHPYRQIDLAEDPRGVTKATAFSSAHQFGLAVDYVAWDGGWSWDAKHDWDYLEHCAVLCGLRVPMKWDRAHVEHPAWPDLHEGLKHMTNGLTR